MANEVFANKMEISCKSGDGKTICAFPDVCFTPPQTPATPPGVPIPYPNTGMSSDCSSGSRTVKIAGGEVMLKNKSFFKTSTGDEAGCAPKKGLITSKTKGKVYFNAWSMDVKIEGQNAVRHLDLTTHNHASPPGQTPPFPEAEGMAVPKPDDCTEANAKTPVQSYDEQAPTLPKGTQSHHVIQNSHFQYPRKTTLTEICPGYSEGAAPCIGLVGGSDVTTPHGAVSRMQKTDGTRYREAYKGTPSKSPTYADARKDAKGQLQAKDPGPGLTEHEAECVMKEVDKKFEEMCPGSTTNSSNFKLRPPGQHGKGLPISGGAGGGGAL